MTNQKDKGQQLAKLLALDAQVSQAMQPAAPPVQLKRMGSFTKKTADASQANAPAGVTYDARYSRLIDQVKAGKFDAASALADVKTDEGRKAIAAAGGIPPLIEMLKTSDENCQKEAARALMSLAAHADNQVAVVKAGGLEPLVALARNPTTGQKEHVAGMSA